jgi:hypothetical protein
MKKRNGILRVCFDVETEPFCAEFKSAESIESRLKHAPKMRIACVFDGKEWLDYLPSEAPALIKLLEAADEVITFNGGAFDELVLQRHHGLNPKVLAKKSKHLDLFAIIYAETDRMVSLDRLAKVNLGEGKHTKGRNTVKLDVEALKVACRSDVQQTYRLWELWRSGQLIIPEQRTSAEKDEPFDIGPGHHMPALCPSCHSVATLVLLEHDMEEMSEGQASDYLAGLYGSACCEACGFEFDWGF